MAPLVALESTIVAHGMPYPQNLTTAREVEAVVRSRGATPATIALIAGNVHIGLEPDELELLARDGAEKFTKVSRRDLAATVANQRYVGVVGGEALHLSLSIPTCALPHHVHWVRRNSCG